MSTGVLARKTISIFAACALAIGLMPLPAFAANAGDETAAQGSAFSVPQRTEEEIDAAVNAMLAVGDYMEGEAIVCSLGAAGTAVAPVAADAAVAGGMATQAAADDLLAGAEQLSTATAEQYVEATGEVLPAAESAAAMSGGLTTQAAAEPVEITLVQKDGMATAELLRALLRDPRVLSAEPNYIMGFESDDEADASAGKEAAQAALGLSVGMAAQDAGDPIAASADLTGYQWFSGGVAGAVQQYADGANPGVGSPHWNDPAEKNASGVVAILDSGVDYTHPDLKNVMYHFSPELQAELGCGEFGYAPAREDKTDPMDGYRHGTHCAGIVAAEWNAFGVSGIANGVKICAVSISKSLTDKDFFYDSIIKGYDFLIRAAKAGVDIRAINRSFDCSPVNNANQVMIQAAGEAGIVTCIASGNSSEDLDVIDADAAMGQPSPYILHVNASKVDDERAGFSCIGRYTTDVFAPGTEILSTVPSNKEEESRYYPQADNEPLYRETSFDGDLFDVTVVSDATSGEGPVQSAKINGISKGTLGFDGDGKSLKLDVTVPSARPSFFYVDVPVGDLSKDGVQDIGIAVYSGSGDVALRGAPYSSVSIVLEDGTLGKDGIGSEFFGSPGGWSFGTVHISDPTALTQDFKRVTDSKGRKCIRLQVAPQIEIAGVGDDQLADVSLYLDTVAIGKRGNAGFLPYQYMNGTSMATPVVAGCVAVASSGITGVSPDMRAAQTVRKLKGAVHQTVGYYGLCRQNGQVDLRLLASADGLVPVLESAEVLGTNVTVRGSYFGTAGTVTVGGVETKAIAWSDTSITVPWPNGVASGLVPISVKSANGAEACRAFILVAPETPEGGAALYERDLSPISLRPDGTSIMDAPQSLAATDNGVLFAAVADGDDKEGATVGNIFRSDDRGVSWTPVPLPLALKNVSIEVGGGTLFIWGATPADDPIATHAYHLYGMDVSTNAVRHLRDYTVPWDDIDPADAEVTECGELAYANGHLFYAFALTDDLSRENPATRMCVQSFNADYSLGDRVTSKYRYVAHSFLYGPMVAATGNSIYICGLLEERQGDSGGSHRGLERFDVDEDGDFTITNLSDAVAGVSGSIDPDNICMTASDQGVILIGNGLEGLLPAGVKAATTETYLLKPDAKTFEAYPRTFSYAPIMAPESVVADGWLYAFGVSKFERQPVIGRSTQLPAPARIDIANATLKASNATYTGKALKPKVTVKYDGKTLAAGTDYELAYANNVRAGAGVAIVTGKGAYEGTAFKSFKIAKARNTLKAKAKKSTLTVGAKTLKRKNVMIAKSKAFSVSKAKGEVIYKLYSVSKEAKGKVAVSSKGKITLKKGLAKGTHTIKVKVKALGTSNYKSKTLCVTFNAKVK